MQKHALKNAGNAIFFVLISLLFRNTAKQAAICAKLAGKIEATMSEFPNEPNSIIPKVINGQCKPKITNG